MNGYIPFFLPSRDRTSFVVVLLRASIEKECPKTNLSVVLKDLEHLSKEDALGRILKYVWIVLHSYTIEP
jgi:hypothetical protein